MIAMDNLFDASMSLVDNALANVDRLFGDIARDTTRVAGEAGDLYSATASAAREVRDAVRGTPRFTRIVTDVARMIASYRFARARAELVGTGAASADLSALHERHAQRIYEMCVELRGGVLKVGQFVSSRVDLLPQPYVDQLSQLQDRVPPVPSDEIRARMEEQLGLTVNQVFRVFDDTPLAAASMAQVHSAELLDGTPEAVKVQVPGIEDLLETDLAAFRVVARMLDEQFPGMNLVTVAQELGRSVRAELDFRAEAASAIAFRQRFDGCADVVVAQVFPEYSTERVLVMERLEGERIVDHLDRCDAARRDAVLTTLLRAFAAQIVDHGVFHCDPHPGNFMVLTTGELAILDFGSVAEMAPVTTHRYAALVASFVARDVRAMVRLLDELGFEADSPDILMRNAEVFLSVFGEQMATLDLAEIDPSAELARAMSLAREFPVRRIPREFVQMARVFGSLGGLFLRYRPRIQLLAILAPFLSRALQTPSR